MKKKLFIPATIILLVVITLTGFKNINTVSNIDDKNPLQDSTLVTGKDIYLQNCAACHKPDLSGTPPSFPSLKDISKKYSREELASILENGRNAMPSFKHLSKQERDAVIGFLLGEETTAEVTTNISPVENGHRLFVANCSSCHKAKPDDPEPTGVKDYGMKPAVLGGINKVYDFEKFTKVLNAGPCYMPSFVDLSEKDKKDIYDYLSSIKNDEMPRGKMMHGKEKMCRGRGMGMGKCKMK